MEIMYIQTQYLYIYLFILYGKIAFWVSARKVKFKTHALVYYVGFVDVFCSIDPINLLAIIKQFEIGS